MYLLYQKYLYKRRAGRASIFPYLPPSALSRGLARDIKNVKNEDQQLK